MTAINSHSEKRKPSSHCSTVKMESLRAGIIRREKAEADRGETNRYERESPDAI